MSSARPRALLRSLRLERARLALLPAPPKSSLVLVRGRVWLPHHSRPVVKCSLKHPGARRLKLREQCTMTLLIAMVLRTLKRHGQSERTPGYNDFKTLTVAQPVEAVFQVEINRPDKANAMSRTFFKELRQCFDTLAGDPTCRAVVICGSGSVFSAGIDLEEFGPTFRAMTATSGEGGKDPARKSVDIMRFVSGMQETFASLNSCPKPVISAIHSACIGAGVDLVCATDIRMASSDAWFSVKEVDIGLCADLGTLQRLPKLIGSDSLARELVFTARKFPAAEALATGFLSSTAENKQELLNRAITLGSEIAARSPVAIQGSKVNMNYSRDHPVDQALQYQALWSSVMLQTVDIPHAMSMAVQRKPPPTFPPL